MIGRSIRSCVEMSFMLFYLGNLVLERLQFDLLLIDRLRFSEGYCELLKPLNISLQSSYLQWWLL